MGISIIQFSKSVILRIIIVTVVPIGVLFFLQNNIYSSNAWLCLIFKSSILFFSIIASIVFLGMSKNEYQLVREALKEKFLRK
jgi:hypothetical protein